jgi:hypothetical protein
MIRTVVIRGIEVLVIALAAYAFFFMPVGRRTPWGHVCAILSTRPAHEAAEDFSSTGKAMQAKVVGEVAGLVPDAGAKK